MMKLKMKSFITICLISSLFLQSCRESGSNVKRETANYQQGIAIATGGNSWFVGENDKSKSINKNGVHNWTALTDVVRTFFYTNRTGKIVVGLNLKVSEGTSVVKVTLGSKSKEIEVSNTDYANIYVGEFEIASKGYHFVDVQGVSKTGVHVAALNKIFLAGPATENLAFIKNEEDFYFGRRGPSVHLSYKNPESKDITWFYNEVKVPKGNDVIGSYFMANGFSYGYFGMQVNSETERRILFSVWSAYDTQDPKQIPKEYTVDLLGNGSGVTIGEFGNEGSGAQSYLVYDWKPDTTYKFLLKGESKVVNSIDYTAYFFAPEIGDWKLIASFRRPKSLKKNVDNMYSFLENFQPYTGHVERKVEFANQWVRDTKGNWYELTDAKYTADATANKGVRFDYDGGVSDDVFYLRNCGFFSDKTDYNVNLTRHAKNIAPKIDFSKLEKPVRQKDESLEKKS